MKNIDYSKGYKSYPDVEKDSSLDIVTGRITISTTISPEFHLLAKQNNISWSEALRVGLSIIFGDLGIREYDNSLNLYKKMRFYQKRLQETLLEINMREKLTKGEENKQK